MAWNDNVRRYIFQLFDGLRDNFLEDTPGQVKTSDKGVNLFDSSDSFSIPQNIDYSRMATARTHDESPPLDVANDSLIIPYPRVRFPLAVAACLLEGESLLEACHTLHLTGDQNTAVEEESLPTFLQNLNFLVFEKFPVWWGHWNLFTRCKDHSPVSPG